MLNEQSGFETNHACGFETAVLKQDIHAQVIQEADLPKSKSSHNPRLFLLSNNPKAPSKAKKTNRKRVVSDDYFQYGTEWIWVNSAKSGIYPSMLTKMIEQLDIATQIHGRILAYRFDLHLKYYTDDNKIMTVFRNRLIQKLKREYGLTDIGFTWVREVERAKSQHYHWVLLLDGNKVRHPSKLKVIIKDLWESIKDGNHMPIIQNPYYFIDNSETRLEATYRISYLAKARGKGYRGTQAKDYQCSRLKPIT